MRYDKFLLSKMNKRTIIDIIRTKGPINRAEIAKLTDLSIPTVMKITDEFYRHRLVHTIGKRVSNGGKRPELLEFISDTYYLVGVDIGRNTVKTIIMDMSAHILFRASISTEETLPPENLIIRIIKLVKNLIEESGIASDKILGMGIGMPGLLDIESGVVLFSPDFKWHNVDLLGEFKKAFPLKIKLENSNRTLAIGEQWFGAGIDAHFVFCINLGFGIGSALIEEGELNRGSSGMSGELGHITLEKDGPECDCGNRGCLEALASGNAIARKAKEVIQDGKDTLIRSLCQDKLEDIDAKLVFDAVRLKDAVAIDIVEEAIEYIGIGIASCINILDPEKIILSGGLVKSADLFMPKLIEVVKKHQMKAAGRKVKINLGTLGEDATAVGAATMLLKSFIDNGGEIK